MKPCSSCRRHLRRTERACPFCGTPCREAAAPVVAVLVLASALVGCTEGLPPEDGDDSSTSTTANVSSSTSEDPSTTAVASGSGMIEGSGGSSSGATTTALDEGTTACSAEGGVAFIYGPPPECDCPDPPPHCNGNMECDLFAQDCPIGEKCTPWANDGSENWNATRCVPVAPDPDQPGDPCTAEDESASGLDSCDQGSLCLDVDDETLMGTCVALCTGTLEMPTCEPEGTVCAISNEVLPLCLPACDPIAQDCPMGDGCYPIQGVWACANDASDGAGYGEPCEFINVCTPGLVCLDGSEVPPGEACEGMAGCCTEICDITDPAGDMQCMGAPGGQICEPWFEAGQAPAGLENVGVCRLP